MSEQRTPPEQLAEGRRLLTAASPGRWYAEHERDGEWTINADHWPGVDDEDSAICLGTFWMCGEHDARATAWLRNAAPALLADADALAGELATVTELREGIDLLRGKIPCKCDPPGSGEEWCTGHCHLQAEIDRLREQVDLLNDENKSLHAVLSFRKTDMDAENDRLRAALTSIAARSNRWYHDDDDEAVGALDDVQRIADAALALAPGTGGAGE